MTPLPGGEQAKAIVSNATIDYFYTLRNYTMPVVGNEAFNVTGNVTGFFYEDSWSKLFTVRGMLKYAVSSMGVGAAVVHATRSVWSSDEMMAHVAARGGTAGTIRFMLETCWERYERGSESVVYEEILRQLDTEATGLIYDEHPTPDKLFDLAKEGTGAYTLEWETDAEPGQVGYDNKNTKWSAIRRFKKNYKYMKDNESGDPAAYLKKLKKSLISCLEDHVKCSEIRRKHAEQIALCIDAYDYVTSNRTDLESHEKREGSTNIPADERLRVKTVDEIQTAMMAMSGVEMSSDMRKTFLEFSLEAKGRYLAARKADLVDRAEKIIERQIQRESEIWDITNKVEYEDDLGPGKADDYEFLARAAKLARKASWDWQKLKNSLEKGPRSRFLNRWENLRDVQTEIFMNTMAGIYFFAQFYLPSDLPWPLAGRFARIGAGTSSTVDLDGDEARIGTREDGEKALNAALGEWNAILGSVVSGLAPFRKT
jgi:hypothetical protein